jgi:methylmalonyl-CoA mutase N-terminal domain/subunit
VPPPAAFRRKTSRKARWEETTLAEALSRAPESAPAFTTVSGMTVPRLASAEDLAGTDPETDIGYPGEYPFTRGIHPTMYRTRAWTTRLFAGFGTPRETNARFKYLLAHGQTGLSVAFHLPTLYGYDSDSEHSRGEVGKEGVAVDSLADMEVLFDGIPLDRVSTSMTINSPAAVLLAMYVAVAEKQGVAPGAISGTIQNDILKEYIAQKEFIFPPAPSMRLIVDTFEYCARHLPRFNSISISGYHIREAGSTAVQELAFTLADGMAYVQAGIDRGLDVDSFAPRLSFFFNSHNDLFEEVAKFRAARRIWARVMRERFGAKNPRSWMLRFHTQTAGCSLTAQQPEVNIVRTTIQALAAALGGTQSLHTNSMDEALCLPTEKAARIALRTQQVIAHESGVTQTVDPLGGSYYVEHLTCEMERQALAYFRRIDELGGVVPAIEAGFFQREITEASYRYQREVESKRRVIVGVNAFEIEEPRIELLRVSDELAAKQIAQLARVKARRDASQVALALGALDVAARGNANMMPPILAAVRAYATVGEICDTLRRVFGEYREPAIY